jgi:hypothetical protein
MTVCNEIKRRIDESDSVESFDPNINRHMDACSECRQFAGERAALRGLLASTARVTAPVNFDAVLHARLAEVKARRPLAWLNAAFYLRAGAATAALVVAAMVTQYTGLFTTAPTEQANPPVPTNQFAANQPGAEGATQANQTPPAPAILPAGRQMAQANAAAAHPPATLAMNAGGSHRPRMANATARRNADVPLITPEEAGMVDSGAIFIPGRNGQRDMTVPTVSLGAQPLIYVNASRQQQPARAVSVSF